MKCRKTLVFVVVSILWLPTLGFGGTISGGGGRGVVCRDFRGHIKSAELLDLFEAKEVFGLQLEPQAKTFEEQIQKTLVKLNKENHQFYLDRKKIRDEFESKTRFVSDNLVLEPVEDSFEPVAPKNCKIEQVANYHQSGRILIKQEIWNAFSHMSKVALILHELAYRDARQWGRVQNSYFVRRFVGFMFSTTALSEYQYPTGYDAEYYCVNPDSSLGMNVDYEFVVSGNRCHDSTRFCQGKFSFRTLAGQIVYDRTEADSVTATEFLRTLDPTVKLNEFSTRFPLQSSIFEGFEFVYTVVEHDGERIPRVMLFPNGQKQFVDLKCTKR